MASWNMVISCKPIGDDETARTAAQEEAGGQKEGYQWVDEYESRTGAECLFCDGRWC